MTVSYVGYALKEVSLKAGVPNVIKLETEETQLNTVVVIGYGTQKKAFLYPYNRPDCRAN